MPRINDSMKNNGKVEYNQGFILFPAGGGDPVKLDKNISLRPQGEPIKLQPPVQREKKRK
jgi:hypothetical protein